MQVQGKEMHRWLPWPLPTPRPLRPAAVRPRSSRCFITALPAGGEAHGQQPRFTTREQGERAVSPQTRSCVPLASRVAKTLPREPK